MGYRELVTLKKIYWEYSPNLFHNKINYIFCDVRNIAYITTLKSRNKPNVQDIFLFSLHSIKAYLPMVTYYP